MNGNTNFDHLHATREERRAKYAQERKERSSGQWSPWTTQLVQPDKTMAGWVNEVHKVHRNGWCAVLVRSFDTRNEFGVVQHGAIRTALGLQYGDLTWREMQKIKDELFGVDVVAVEVFPRGDHVVDGADMRHLWVLPKGLVLPFGLHIQCKGIASA